MFLLVGGFICGLIAGAAARYGHMCSMGAIEDAVVGGNWRGVKAWGLALASAVIATQTLYYFGIFDPLNTLYATTAIDWPAALLGGIMFGLGMSMVGTCCFGLLVRLGGGDIRALITTVFVGITAIAVNSGALSNVRQHIEGISLIPLDAQSQSFAPGLLASVIGTNSSTIFCRLMLCVLFWCAAFDDKLLRRPRLMLSAIALGLAVAAGWGVTGMAYQEMDTARVESLSFVAPGGRAILQFMSEGLRDTTFGIASLFGVIAGALLIAIARNEISWEAFDDTREMRRHIFGAFLMGSGGILAKGCTIGQGLSAGSVLSLTMPVAVMGIFLGAKVGLAILMHSPILGQFKIAKLLR
ncbi:MAG: YeeE/YedE family protein [Proteobacteria bacterium]|nr:YeeE/YedE family protein [Pseudomonadota bacterium]